MKYPKYLSENGTIGFVAPSFGCNTEPYRSVFVNAQKKLQALGHTLELGPNCYEGRGIGISNTPQACGEELTDYYCSGRNDVLISCGGGELMCEILEYVDFDKIRAAKPKWYMGYSDNTNMTFLLTTLCDTASIYGPCAGAFGMEPWHESIQDAYDLLRGRKDTVHGYDLWEKDSQKSEEEPLAPYHVTEKRRLRIFLPDNMCREENVNTITEEAEQEAANEECERKQPEAVTEAADEERKRKPPKADRLIQAPDGSKVQLQIEGRLIGGCMDCLVNLLGTKYDKVTEFAEQYKEDGVIWFLESCDLNVMSIRRAIWQMKNAGWFSYVKGFLIGRPAVYGQEMMGLDQYHAVCDLLAELHVPVIMDADIGHLSPMMPLVCGSHAAVQVNGNDISIEMKCL